MDLITFYTIQRTDGIQAICDGRRGSNPLELWITLLVLNLSHSTRSAGKKLR